MMKLKIFLFFSVFMTTLCFNSAFAMETWEVKNEENIEAPLESVGISTEPPVELEEVEDGFTILGIDRPVSRHNVLTSGRMNFAGSAELSTLYTNKRFTGLSSYKIEMKNFRSTSLTVTLMKVGTFHSTVQTYTVSPNSTRNAYPSSLDHTADYYLRFSAPSNFSGYVDR